MDVDLDTYEAIAAAPLLLPRTLTHGRPNKSTSHWWYRAPGAKSETFKDSDGTMLVEIRAHSGQTMIPPSVHPSGERVAWDTDSPLLPMDPGDLLDAVAKWRSRRFSRATGRRAAATT